MELKGKRRVDWDTVSQEIRKFETVKKIRAGVTPNILGCHYDSIMSSITSCRPCCECFECTWVVPNNPCKVLCWLCHNILYSEPEEKPRCYNADSEILEEIHTEKYFER